MNDIDRTTAGEFGEEITYNGLSIDSVSGHPTTSMTKCHNDNTQLLETEETGAVEHQGFLTFLDHEVFRKILMRFAKYNSSNSKHLKTNNYTVNNCLWCINDGCSWCIHTSIVDGGPHFKVRSYN